MNNPKFQIFKGKDDKFYFRLYARNGQQIINSQGYTSKANCKKGIESVKSNSGQMEHFEIKSAANDKFFFNLMATNKQVIASSQMYTSKSGCEKGIHSVQTVAPESPVEDTTV